MKTNSQDQDTAARAALALEVIARLKREYPDTHCTLNYEDAWQLLVSVRLAAQCTDLRVDQVTPKLYAKFPTVQALAEAPVEEIEEIVRPCGLGPSKARDISKCMKMLHEQYDDRVPESFEELLKLPGVGRKSANLVMGDVFGKPAIVTDTHCIRLSNLIGFVDDVKEPGKVEKLLWKIIPPEEGNQLCHRQVEHGRTLCIARRPQCSRCCLKDICRYGKTQ
ncbi:MAG: endonuclease III domain-containing protein [Lachnospiraceae bacterium]